MKLTKGKKIILMIALMAFVVLLFNSNTIFAEINTEYIGDESVLDEGLEEAFQESTLLNLLARLIYAVGRFLEWILGIIFELLTGSRSFPWADKIVFNAVPILDVNFLSPGEGSFFANGAVKTVIKNLYSTTLALAVAFFGLVVMITAIKLVISTIASDKAKYKQAIIDWVIGLVMLFCIHFFISFVFYLNEQMVVVASKIVTNQIDTVNADVINHQMSSDMVKLIENVRKSGVKYNGREVADILEANPNILLAYMNLDNADTAKGLPAFLLCKISWTKLWDKTVEIEEQYRRLGLIISWAADDNVTTEQLRKIRGNIKLYMSAVNGAPQYNQALFKEDFDTIFGEYNEEIIKKVDKLNLYPATSNVEDMFVYEKNGKYRMYLSSGSNEFSDIYPQSDTIVTTFYWNDLITDLITLKNAKGMDDSKGIKLLSGLASYFRYFSYAKELGTSNNVTGLKNSGNIQIQNMIMYSVLVIQSVILFIAYIKRLFYVLLLAMMAPLVVVMDFFQKFGK